MVPRFLEVMPIAEGAKLAREHLVTAAEMQARLAAHLLPEEGADGAGPRAREIRARRGVIPSLRAGFITGTSDTFCETCDRLRVSSTGVLRPCLATDDGRRRGAPWRAPATPTRSSTPSPRPGRLKPDGDVWKGCTEETAADVSMRAIGGGTRISPRTAIDPAGFPCESPGPDAAEPDSSPSSSPSRACCPSSTRRPSPRAAAITPGARLSIEGWRSLPSRSAAPAIAGAPDRVDVETIRPRRAGHAAPRADSEPPPIPTCRRRPRRSPARSSRPRARTPRCRARMRALDRDALAHTWRARSRAAPT